MGIIQFVILLFFVSIYVGIFGTLIARLVGRGIMDHYPQRVLEEK